MSKIRDAKEAEDAIEEMVKSGALPAGDYKVRQEPVGTGIAYKVYRRAPGEKDRTVIADGHTYDAGVQTAREWGKANP